VGEAARPCRVMVRLQPVRTAGRLRRRSGLAGPLTVSQVASFSGLDADEISPGVHLLLAVFRRSDLGGAPLTLVVAGHNRRSGRMNRPMRGHLPDPGNSSYRSTPDRFRHGRSGDLGGMPKLVRRARSGTDHLGIIFATVATLWRRWGLQPWKAHTFKFSTDPELEAKIRDFLGLYLDPPERAVVLCVDEKTQIQGLDRTAPILPLRPGIPDKQTHDYRRYGTTNLFAAHHKVASHPRH